jgi:hypothetical protein
MITHLGYKKIHVAPFWVHGAIIENDLEAHVHISSTMTNDRPKHLRPHWQHSNGEDK